MISPLAYYFLLLAVAGFAFLLGRRDERMTAAICVGASLASTILVSPLYTRYTAVETGVLLVDTAALVGFTAIALRSERFWPLWVAGLQLTTILSHLMKGARLELIPEVYAAAGRFWVYPIFLIILIGTWRGHQRRVRETQLT